MRTVVISVNNKVIDFFPEAGFDIAPLVFKRLFNAQNLDQVSGNFTLNFKLPLTEKNRETFSFIDQNDEVLSFGDLQKLKCSIVADSDLIIKGTLTIKGITDTAYEVTLIGDNIDWANIFKQRSLRDITLFRKPVWSGARSTLYNPWGPNQYPNSVGYGDMFDNNATVPLGQMEDMDFDFATPLISYGNFPYPRIQGYIENNFGVYYIAVINLDTNFMPLSFPYPVYFNGQFVTVTSQISGFPGAVGAYGVSGTPANYGSASDLKDFFLIDNSLYPFQGVNTGYWFYNNPDFPLTWRDLKPAPYLVTTIKRMFQDLQYNVGGDFFNNPKFKNIIIPYVNNDEENKIEPWNYQVMGRLNTQFTQGNNGQVSTYNWIRFNNGENSQALQFPGNHRVQLIRPNYTLYNGFTGAGDLQNSWTPAIVNKNENYMYSDTFFDFDSPGANQNNSFQSYTVPKDGTYNLTYIFRQFGAKNFTALTQNNWNNGGIGSKFFYMFVKRTDNTWNGSLGQGLVFWDGSAFVTDPDVIYSLEETITANPFYTNMGTTPQDKTITTTVDLKYGEVIEFMVAICGFGNPGPFPVLPALQLPMDDRLTVINGNQQLTIEKGSISDFIVTPLSFETELNPANWLPDINQADFLKSVINTFNLFVSYDEQNNRIDINEYENNFLPLGTSQDFTNKTTIEYDVKKEPLDKFKQVLFNEVIDESDILSLSAVPTETYTNNLNNFTEIKNINVLWTETAIKEYRSIGDNNTTVYPESTQASTFIPIPTLSSESVNQAYVYDLPGGYTYDINYNIRLLKYEGLKGYYSNAGIFRVEDTGYAPSVFVPDLASKKPIPQATTLNINYVDNWAKWFKLIENNILYTIKAKILTSDIAQIDLRKPIQIGNRTFIINSIEAFNVLEDTPTIMKIFKKK